MIFHLSITIAVDNTAEPNCEAEHGLAFWIEADNRRLLWDTGQGSALPTNASILGIPIQQTEILALSHGHYDHMGGIPYVLEQAPSCIVYYHPDVCQSRYRVTDEEVKSIGMPNAARDTLQRLPSNQKQVVTEPVRLAPHMGLTGPIHRTTPFETMDEPFFLDIEGRQRETLWDDQTLWFDTTEGLVICTGCCHAGIINPDNAVSGRFILSRWA